VSVAWNWSDNQGSSGIAPAHCSTGSTSCDEGTPTLTTSCGDLTGTDGRASYADAGAHDAPTVTCAPVPVPVPVPVPGFLLNQTGVLVAAAVGDATSAPRQSSVSAVASAGPVDSVSVSLTGCDSAGDATAVACSYTVG
jgi:hypothetical protein